MVKTYRCRFCEDFETDYVEVLYYHWESCEVIEDLADEAERR